MNLVDIEQFDNEYEDVFEDADPYFVYPVIRDGKKAMVVEVQDGPSDWVIWNMKDGKMIKTFDFEELPF